MRRAGVGDAPWPPHFPKAEGEPTAREPRRGNAVSRQEGGEPST